MMNWRRVSLTLLVVGAALAAGGLLWQHTAHRRAYDCRIDNVIGIVNGVAAESCPTTAPGWVMAGIGAGVLVLGVVLLNGATQRQ